MVQEVRDKLLKLVETYGCNVLDYPIRVRNLLNDLCKSRFKKEIYAIFVTLKAGAYTKLVDSAKSSSVSITIAGLIERIQNDYAIEESLSSWSVESICESIGISYQKDSSASFTSIINDIAPQTSTAEAVLENESETTEIQNRETKENEFDIFQETSETPSRNGELRIDFKETAVNSAYKVRNKRRYLGLAILFMIWDLILLAILVSRTEGNNTVQNSPSLFSIHT